VGRRAWPPRGDPDHLPRRTLERPLYARYGFRVIEERDLGVELAAIRADERRRGLDARPRTAMRRVLGDPP
jgi:hypothetical protein